MRLGEWQKHLGGIYPNADKNVDYIYCHIARGCGEISRSIRKSDDAVPQARRDNIVRQSITVISWMIALANKIGVDFEEAFTARFPARCPYCLSSPCVCLDTAKRPPRYMTDADIEEELGHARSALVNDVSVRIDLDWCVKNISRIFPNNRYVWMFGGPHHFFDKLMEEMAELHQAYSNYLFARTEISSVARELADLSAWIFAIWGVEAATLGNIEAEFQSYYRNGCPVCRKPVCGCPQYLTSSTFPGLIAEIRDQIGLFVDGQGISRELSQELIELLNQVKANPAAASGARAGILQRLKTASEAAATMDRMSGNVVSATKNVGTLFDSFDKLLALLP